MIFKSINWKKAILVSSISLFGAITAMSQDLPTRDKVQDKYKWKLEDLYENNDSWEKDFNFINSQLSTFRKFENRVTKDAKTLLQFLEFNNKVGITFSRLYMFANCAADLDLNDGKSQLMRQKMAKLGSDYSAATAFFRPELLKLSPETLESYKKSEKRLEPFFQMLDDLLRFKPYTLSSGEERLLAKLSPINDIADDTYSVLNDAELPFPTVKGEKGEDVVISHGRYRSALFSTDRDYRERIYKGTYVPYKQLISTFASLFNGRVKTRIINAESKGYKSAREASLFADNISPEIYDNLVKTINTNIGSQHRWGELKKKVLKLNDLHPYDTYVTLFPGVQKSYTFDEAKKICLDALKPLGEEYQNTLKMAFDNRWIDVYETKGKRSGAYSNGCGCGVHPWILLNWNNTMDDLFTLVHELGHNMHSFFTEKTQPFHYANYTTFLAEIASTTNEALLLDYLIDHAGSKEEKSMLIEKFLVNAQQTLFRQTQFAEFELKVHEKAEKGEFMDADGLTKQFSELYQNYWGPSMKTDYEEGLSWARIPHLYHYNFYVFQYATGFSAAQALSEMIKKEGKPAIDRYLKMLSSGSSKYTIDLLKDAGVDMSTPKPIEATIAKFNKYLGELEQITK